MAKRSKDQGPDAGPPEQTGGDNAEFPVHEHIGRTLKALFDEVAAQPVPEKLQDLLRELERKKAKD